MITMSLIHCNLRVLMAKKGLNIQNVKDKTSLSRTTISNLYNNYGHGIQFDTLLELCNLLNCTPGDMFSIIEIIMDFKVVSEVNSSRIEKVIEAVNVTEIEIQLEMNCDLRYEGEDYNLDFLTHLTYHMYEGKDMHRIKIDLPTSLHEELDNFLSTREKNHFLYELSDFLIDEWGIERLKTEGFEDANRFVVDFQTMK